MHYRRNSMEVNGQNHIGRFPPGKSPIPTGQEEEGWAVKRTSVNQPVISHYTPTLGDFRRRFLIYQFSHRKDFCSVYFA
jgi:hypothetical protein